MYHTDDDYRDTHAIISLKAYRNNLRFFKEKAYPAKIMPVIKADGYGHGAVELARVAESEKVEYLVVAFLSEALELRTNGIQTPILVLNYFKPEYVNLFVENDLTATVYSLDQFHQLQAFLHKKPLKIHVILDTGMSRVGFNHNDAVENIQNVLSDTHFEVTGLYTHFSSADEQDLAFTKLQYDRFQNVAKHFESIPFKHVANSAGALFFEENLFDFVRIGIASYGLDPKNLKREDPLEPVLSWETAVSMVKWISKETPVSYGRTFIAEKAMKVATIPVGYADGYNRLLSNTGEVLIGGKRCRVLGRVCMDQFVVNADDIENIQAGDRVVLLGKMGNEEISAEELAQRINTINYEVTCAISKRVVRKYVI
ncbi:MAG TPA: alanine racemase [Thermotogota bacterium]|nr:alanine racemase [Thermotogota bacterium]HRW34605.1 alanine racemase [Thermotogota bacterium]